jgi:serine/threonine protein kinase
MRFKAGLHLLKPLITTNSSSIIKTANNLVSKVYYNKEIYSNEIKILSTLIHPNIIKVHDHYLDEYNKGVIEFKYYDDGDLLTFINSHVRVKHTHINNTDKINLFCTITDTLLFCHKHNIVHGDIKPDNIMLNNFNPILIDFGLSIYNTDFTNYMEKNIIIRSGRQGSDGFMAPEVLDNYIGPCSDVYSLGVVLYQLFTNEMPSFYKNKLDLDFTIIKKYNIPSNIVNILHDMLEHDYKQRPTIEDIKYELITQLNN